MKGIMDLLKARMESLILSTNLIWEMNTYMEAKVDLDKDILFKGNKVYSPETCAFVPHEINTLFVNRKACRGELPVGVYYDTEKGKYRANMAFMGRSIKLGTFDTADEAFARYKEYKGISLTI